VFMVRTELMVRVLQVAMHIGFRVHGKKNTEPINTSCRQNAKC
jgi:acetolactate synthase regulatory subunit